VTPIPYRLVVGSQLSLTCVYDGDSNEKIDQNQLMFTKDGHELPTSTSFSTCMEKIRNTVSLKIISSRISGLEMQDGGSYECRYGTTFKFQKYIDVFDSKLYLA
jgi:hypothetical protein